jgi:hypothetical protein
MVVKGVPDGYTLELTSNGHTDKIIRDDAARLFQDVTN